MALGYSPDGGRIAFEQGGWIHVARLAGGDLDLPRRVARGTDARWLDRTSLAVRQRDAVRTFTVAGRPGAVLLRGVAKVRSFDVEPGGRRIAFNALVERGRGEEDRVFVARVGSSVRTDVTPPGRTAVLPVWQPR